jgi:hypothetical protein
VMLGYVVGSPNIMAMGDDSVEVGTFGAKAQYERMGHIVKLFDKSQNGFEFCSTRIYMRDGKIVGEPVNWSRTFYRLLHATKDHDDRYRQFCFEMRHSPHLQPCINALQRVGWWPSKHAKEEANTSTEGSCQAASPNLTDEGAQGAGPK